MGWLDLSSQVAWKQGHASPFSTYTGLNLPKNSATMVDPFALLRFWRAIFWRVGRRGCSTYTCTVVANHARNRRVFPTKAVPFIKQRLLQAGSARGQGSRQSLCSVSLLTLVSSRTISQHGQRACACPPACLQLHHGLVAGIFFKLNRKATVSFEIWLYKALKRISLSNALVWFKLMFFFKVVLLFAFKQSSSGPIQSGG